MADGRSSRGRGGSKRSRTDQPFENAPETRCDGCNDLNESSYAELDGCGHKLCFQCFGAAQATRSVRFNMVCPCCNKKEDSSGSTRNAQPQHQPPVSQEITPPLDDSFMKSHPNIYYQHQTTEYRSKYAILSLAAPPLPRVLYSIGIGVRT